jgi:hypothetical protein
LSPGTSTNVATNVRTADGGDALGRSYYLRAVILASSIRGRKVGASLRRFPLPVCDRFPRGDYLGGRLKPELSDEFDQRLQDR